MNLSTIRYKFLGTIPARNNYNILNHELNYFSQSLVDNHNMRPRHRFGRRFSTALHYTISKRGYSHRGKINISNTVKRYVWRLQLFKTFRHNQLLNF
jgi:hypothetical protein